MLSEALKIKLSKLKHRGDDVQIIVTISSSYYTELLDKYRQHYLVNMGDIIFTNIEQLCLDLNIKHSSTDSQSTMTNVVRSLSNTYAESLVILLWDEVMCFESPDWSNMETCHNVIWLMAINPQGGGVGNMNIVSPTSDDVLCQQLYIKYRNCFQIRLVIVQSNTNTIHENSPRGVGSFRE